LREKVAAVQAAVNAMDGAQSFECALATTAKKLFFSSWPGWTHSSYHHRELYAEDTYLADLLPFSATFVGALDQAEALYDGSHGNLVGVSAAVGGSPQHAVLIGMTGAGKSAFIEDLLFQTADHFSHSLLIEEGFSYKRFTEAMGETPIVIHPDAALTLNYLDTQRLPLTQLHLATAVALLARMVGQPDNAQELALRQAQLTQYLHQLYRDTFTDWSRRHAAEAEDVRRLACAVHGWRIKLGGATPLEAFVDLRDRRASGEVEALAFVAGLTEETITRFAQDPATERQVAQTACAFYAPEEFPTHGALVELLAYARLPEHNRDEIDRLATLLRAWTADGQYGRLFDGVTNVSLQRKIAHFELGFIPEHAVELKTAAGLLISGLGRQHILALPRVQRKRILFEEMSRFLDTPGGEQIVAESYAQLRKHNCWAVSVIQQYARFKGSRIRAAVIGNAKQFFLMRQNDRGDLTDLAGDLPLPETAVDAIQRYPLPEQLPADQRHSSLCFFTPTAQPPQCGTLRHFQEEPCTRAT
jgi:type IV secretory pathway VirB4 component